MIVTKVKKIKKHRLRVFSQDARLRKYKRPPLLHIKHPDIPLKIFEELGKIHKQVQK